MQRSDPVLQRLLSQPYHRRRHRILPRNFPARSSTMAYGQLCVDLFVNLASDDEGRRRHSEQGRGNTGKGLGGGRSSSYAAKCCSAMSQRSIAGLTFSSTTYLRQPWHLQFLLVSGSGDCSKTRSEKHSIRPLFRYRYYLMQLVLLLYSTPIIGILSNY